MKLRALIFVTMMAAAIAPARCASAQAVSDDAQLIDGIAARIDTDVITESEVRELAAFQMLVDGSAKPRDQLISELSDQWIVHSEAETARFPHPSDADIENAYAQLSKLFATPQEFAQRTASVGLTEAGVRRQLEAQLYLSRFIDFRFRPASEVDDAAVKKYYDGEFVPQLKQRNEPVPEFDKVQDTIREVLIQREINDRANQWLSDTRSHLEIDVLPAPPGGAQ
ncbi:MAG TPA: hypothetical protein VNU84_01590 [Candidatus Acidoferrum sp.]|jgi:hypothetical protein|nr:hypothetical protein [Candidatus Acidoferrum sp.]